MAPGAGENFLQLGAFDKAERWRKAAQSRVMTDEQRQPLFRRGIWTNLSASGRTSPMVLLELMPCKAWCEFQCGKVVD